MRSGVRRQESGVRRQGAGFRVVVDKEVSEWASVMALTSYRDLVVWQRAMDLVVEVYHISKALPRQEQSGLVSQLCRAGVSVPANIAEGYGRKHRKEYVRFLIIAKGSLQEARTHLEICIRLGYISQEHARHSQHLAEEVSKMLTGLIQSLNPES